MKKNEIIAVRNANNQTTLNSGTSFQIEKPDVKESGAAITGATTC